MKNNSEVIKILNAQLTNELTAINQYFLHARIYKNWGLEKIAKKEYAESIDEMKHADQLINRILILNHLPDLQTLHKLMIGKNVIEILQYNLQLEQAAQKTVKEGIIISEEYSDFVSLELFQHILDDTETHIHWLEIQLELIKKIGLQNFLQMQVIEA